MRSLLAHLITSGGLLAAIAFFVPWVAVSCNDNSLGTVSPHDRAVGLDAEAVAGDSGVRLSGAGAEREPGYWLLLVVPLAVAAAGVTMTLRGARSLRATGATGAALALVGLLTTVWLGLGDRLGVKLPDTRAAEIVLRVVFEPGVWISVAGYTLALAGGIAAVVLGGRREV